MREAVVTPGVSKSGYRAGLSLDGSGRRYWLRRYVSGSMVISTTRGEKAAEITGQNLAAALVAGGPLVMDAILYSDASVCTGYFI